jgi:1-acyl-sn-glycerol-3-phosphate acyltransferase
MLPVWDFKFMVSSKYYYGWTYRWPLRQIVRWLFKHSGVCIPATFRIAKEALRDGHSLIIFPEGRISPDGKLGRLRKGAAYFHVYYEIPILPVKIEGTNVPGLFKKVQITYGSPFKFMGPLRAVNKKLKEGMKRL